MRWTSALKRQPRRRAWKLRSGVVPAEVLELRQLLTALNLTDNEQLLIELINRARANPEAEATRYGIDLNQGLTVGTISTSPKQPLGPHQSLIDAARLHAQDMLDRDYFDHTTLGSGQTPAQRAQAAGYPTSLVGENIAWGGTTGVLDQIQEVYDRHESLFLSPGHRTNIMGETYEEIGAGVRYGQFTDGSDTFNASMVAESFGIRNVNPLITGVVYTDSSNDQFYSIGEAIRSGTITITNSVSGTIFTDTIGNSGGYSIAVPAGTYIVSATYTRAGATRNVSRAGTLTVTDRNIKVDFETTTAEAAVSNLTLSAAVTSLNESGTGSTTTLTVTRSGNLTTAITVNLQSADTTELTVPATVSFSAGQQSAQVTISAVSDGIIDGTQTSVITASLSGLTSGTISVRVLDRTAPLLPSGVQTVSTSRPTFTWSSVSNAATYEIQVDNNSTGQTRIISQAGIATTSMVSPVDLPLGTFYVWVRGITSTGRIGSWSPAAVWKVNTPPAITNPVRTVSSGNFSTVWSAVPGAVSYDVWVDRLTSATSQYFRNTAVVGTSVDMTGFNIGRYGIWVRGRNSRGDLGNWSSQGVVTVSIPVAGVSVTAASLNSVATLNWAAVPGATQYDVWVNNSTTGVSQVIRNTTVSATSLAMTTLGAGAYRAWIRARDNSGANHAWSNPFDFDIQKAPRLLSPTGSGQPGTPLFSWTPTAGATRYELWVSNQANVRVVTETNITGTSWTPSISLPAGTYRTWIRAFDGTNPATGWSSVLTFTI